MTEFATLDAAIDAAATAHGSRVAIWARDETLTYSELMAAASRTASALLEHGLTPGDRVAILTLRSLAAYTAIVAALRAGCVYVPLNRRFPLARNRALLESSGATVLVVDDECRERFADLLTNPPSSLAMVVSIDGEVTLPRGSRLSSIDRHEISATRPRTTWPVRTPRRRLLPDLYIW